MGGHRRQDLGRLRSWRPQALSEKPGYTVYSLKPEEIAAWQKAAEPVRQQWAGNAKKAGVTDPNKTLADLEASIKKYGAEFK